MMTQLHIVIIIIAHQLRNILREACAYRCPAVLLGHCLSSLALVQNWANAVAGLYYTPLRALMLCTRQLVSPSAQNVCLKILNILHIF